MFIKLKEWINLWLEERKYQKKAKAIKKKDPFIY